MKVEYPVINNRFKAFLLTEKEKSESMEQICILDELIRFFEYDKPAREIEMFFANKYNSVDENLKNYCRQVIEKYSSIFFAVILSKMKN